MGAREYSSSVAIVLAVMAAVALLEGAVPFFVRPTLSGRRKTNLAMTLQTLLFAFVLSAGTAVAAVYVPFVSPGLMPALGLPTVAQLPLGIVALDFAFGYAAHRSMHASPALWTYHRVH